MTYKTRRLTDFRIIVRILGFLNRGIQVGIHCKGSLIPSAVLRERERTVVGDDVFECVLDGG